MSGIDTVGDVLVLARSLGVERLDAQLLIAHVQRRDRSWVIAHHEAPIDDATALRVLFARRAAGEPLAYLVGRREFRGLVLHVTPDVLVPRPDTEMLVDWALELLTGPMAPNDTPRVLDLGTGSGAIALAIKHACPRAQVHAVDISTAALDVARGNACTLGLELCFHHGHWWSAVQGMQFDLVLANPPYVAADDPHLASLTHEPALALVPAEDRGDGLSDIERIVDGAIAALQPGAWLLLEHGFNHDRGVGKCLHCAGFSDIATRTDLAGRPRATGGRRPR